MNDTVTYSIIVPVSGNAESVRELIARLGGISTQLDGAFEVIFVVDGSPDNSLELLRQQLPRATMSAWAMLDTIQPSATSRYTPTPA